MVFSFAYNLNAKIQYLIMPYTYIIYSNSKDRYYIGATGIELNDRLRRHNTNHKGYTGGAKDWIIVYFEEFQTMGEALEQEKQLKAWKSRKRIENLITKQ